SVAPARSRRKGGERMRKSVVPFVEGQMLHPGIGPVPSVVAFLPGMSFAVPIFEVIDDIARCSGPTCPVLFPVVEVATVITAIEIDILHSVRDAISVA